MRVRRQTREREREREGVGETSNSLRAHENRGDCEN